MEAGDPECWACPLVAVTPGHSPFELTLHTSAAAAKSLQSCPTLCDPIDGSPPGSPVPGILQARTLEWVAISFSNAWKWKSEIAQSCPTPSDPMDCSLRGSSVHGICQARVFHHLVTWKTVCIAVDHKPQLGKSKRTEILRSGVENKRQRLLLYWGLGM